MILISRVLIAAAALTLAACASESFVSSWKAPDATPLQVEGAKVGAVVMVKDDAMRRDAEDTLAREISARGAQGIPGYTVLEGRPSKEREAEAKAAFERAGVQGVVVMRPVSVDKDVTVTPVTYGPSADSGFWGGYYGQGWSTAYAEPMGGDVHTTTTVTIETLVYSLRQNKLVWKGQSRTTDPKNVESLVKKLSAATAKELDKQGLLR
jgi:hypothetical protein